MQAMFLILTQTQVGGWERRELWYGTMLSFLYSQPAQSLHCKSDPSSDLHSYNLVTGCLVLCRSDLICIPDLHSQNLVAGCFVHCRSDLSCVPDLHNQSCGWVSCALQSSCVPDVPSQSCGHVPDVHSLVAMFLTFTVRVLWPCSRYSQSCGHVPGVHSGHVPDIHSQNLVAVRTGSCGWLPRALQD